MFDDVLLETFLFVCCILCLSICRPVHLFLLTAFQQDKEENKTRASYETYLPVQNRRQYNMPGSYILYKMLEIKSTRRRKERRKRER